MGCGWRLRAGVAAGAYGVSAGGRRHAAAVELGLAAQPHPCRVRQLPGEAPATALAVGPQALLGRAAGRRPRVRRPRLAVHLRLPRRCGPTPLTTTLAGACCIGLHHMNVVLTRTVWPRCLAKAAPAGLTGGELGGCLFVNACVSDGSIAHWQGTQQGMLCPGLC